MGKYINFFIKNIFVDISKNKNAHLNFSIKQKYPYKSENNNNNNNIFNFYLKTKVLIKKRVKYLITP
jgi:hypothetical protein